MVPGDWKESGTPGVANAKVAAEASVVIVNDPFQLKPIPESMLKPRKIETVFENTTKRVFSVSSVNGALRTQ